MKELDRLQLMTRIAERRLTRRRAAELLGLSVGDHREAQKFEHGLEAGTGCARG